MHCEAEALQHRVVRPGWVGEAHVLETDLATGGAVLQRGKLELAGAGRRAAEEGEEAVGGAGGALGFGVSRGDAAWREVGGRGVRRKSGGRKDETGGGDEVQLWRASESGSRKEAGVQGRGRP